MSRAEQLAIRGHRHRVLLASSIGIVLLLAVAFVAGRATASPTERLVPLAPTPITAAARPAPAVSTIPKACAEAIRRHGVLMQAVQDVAHDLEEHARITLAREQGKIDAATAYREGLPSIHHGMQVAIPRLKLSMTDYENVVKACPVH